MAVPYVDGTLWRAVVGACDAQAQRVLPFAITPLDVYRYAELVTELWAVPVDLIVCEQDVIPPPGSLVTMHRCPHDWCTLDVGSPGQHQGGMLGLARFSLRLRRQLPAIARQALVCGPPGSERAPWPTVSDRLADGLAGAGVRRHVHAGRAVHLHPFNAR